MNCGRERYKHAKSCQKDILHRQYNYYILLYLPTTFESQNILHSWKKRMVVVDDDGMKDIHFKLVETIIMVVNQSFQIILQCDLIRNMSDLVTTLFSFELLGFRMFQIICFL